MGKADLIHLKPKGDAYSDGIRAKLKGTTSQRKKDSAIIRGLKMANPETIQKRGMELVLNSQTSALTIMQYMSELIKKKDLDDSLKIQLLGKMCQAHTTIHGAKMDLTADMKIASVGEEVINRLRSFKKLQNEVGEEKASEIRLKENVEELKNEHTTGN